MRSGHPRALLIPEPISPHFTKFSPLHLLTSLASFLQVMSLSADSAQQQQQVANAASSSTFTFKAPYPPTTPGGSQGASKQRRVSLALPNTPRLVPAWNFRDDTTIDAHVTSSTPLTEKKGKMRRSASTATNPSDNRIGEILVVPEKRQRKKWTEEETQMLVNGCNIVSAFMACHDQPFDHFLFLVGCWQLESNS